MRPVRHHADRHPLADFALAQFGTDGHKHPYHDETSLAAAMYAGTDYKPKWLFSAYRKVADDVLHSLERGGELELTETGWHRPRRKAG